MARRLTLAVAALLIAGCASRPPADGPAPSAAIPGRAEALLEAHARAEAAYAAGRHAEAADLYAGLAQARPGDAAYWYRLGNALVRTGEFADAGFAYQRALALEPGNSRAWHNLGVVHMHQAQQALAESVKHAKGDTRAFDASLRLSAGLYSLVESGTLPDTTPPRAPETELQP